MTGETEACTRTWSTERTCTRFIDGRDPAHQCGVTDEHAMCRCACGMTKAKRPVVSVTLEPNGMGRVQLGDTDLSSHVSSVTVKAIPGNGTVIEVGMIWAQLAARGEVELSEETAKALEALGWSGPDTELLRRRDLQEALGGLGTVLREWDSLLGWVRVLAEHNTELHAQQDLVLHKVAEALGRYAPDEVKWSRVLEEITELAARGGGPEA